MTYYIRDNLPPGPVLGARRPTINEFFLSSYNLGIYTGCELGCPYCDGWAFMNRPLNETVRVPLDLPQRLAGELETIDRGNLVAISALSDPYQPAEQLYRITRQVLTLFADVGQPCLVMTKSASVLEDLPLLQRINEKSLAIVMTTILTLDPHLAERLEGKSPLPGVRLEMLATLKRAGIPVGVALLPVMPYINDTEYTISTLMRACAQANIDFVIWDYLHMPNDRHRTRINEILARIASYPASYYRDIYGTQPVVSAAYRSDRDSEILKRCDGWGLDCRVPHKYFAGRLHPNNEAALLLKHTAFRDMVQGRTYMANMHRELADQVYRGETPRAQLSISPLWPTLCQILQLEE